MSNASARQTCLPWISSAADSPARMSAGPGRAPASPSVPAPDSGTSTGESSQSSRPASSSPKTSRAGKAGGCARCGPTCTLLDTEPVPSRFLPRTSGPRTSGDGSSLWATAAASDWKTTSKPGQRRGQLASQLWPTATACSYGTGQNGCPRDGRAAFAGKGAPSLSTLARLWPTATATATDASASRRHGYMLTGHSGTTLHDAIDFHLSAETSQDGPITSHPAVLNPRFVEALMGFPPGWTEIPSPQVSLLQPSDSLLSETQLSPNAPKSSDE